ncbi:Uncharacterized protein Fot_35657 [Forsythia ovata]|uniref:Uncharacterized protein n=1 Tax=Forsythia ovata TaxID=205694 RepID=A0ABD1SNJ8_9LAMI
MALSLSTSLTKLTTKSSNEGLHSFSAIFKNDTTVATGTLFFVTSMCIDFEERHFSLLSSWGKKEEWKKEIEIMLECKRKYKCLERKRLSVSAPAPAPAPALASLYMV